MQLVVTAQSYAKELEACLDKNMTGVISKEVHTRIMDELASLAKRYTDTGFLEVRRRCIVGYGPYEVELVMTDALLEAHVRYMARLKTLALGAPDGLPYLPYEDVLFDAPPDSATVHELLLEEMREGSRRMFSDVMSCESMTSFANIQEEVERAKESCAGPGPVNDDRSAVHHYRCAGVPCKASRALSDQGLAGGGCS